MEVNTKSDKSTAVVGEMFDTGEVGSIAEMVTDAARLDSFIPGASARGAELAQAAGDDSPDFVVIRVEEGWSRSRRLWSGQELESIAEQTNRLQPVGHLGHIPDDQAATSMPDPQTTWIAATVKEELSQQKDRKGETVKVAYFAGYNLAGSKIRGYLKAKAVRGISWWGTGEQVAIPGKGVQVKGFQLRALDWARKLSEGMPTSSVVAMAKEMEEGSMAKELAQVTPEEFKSENPNGYALIVAQATADSDKRIAEMETEIEAAQEDKKLLAEARKALKLDEGGDILGTLATVMSKLGDKAKATLDAALAKILEEKVPDEAQRKLVLRLLPVGEMETKLEDAKPEDSDKLIAEMVDDAIDTDDTIKTVIGEQAPPAIRRREDLRGGNDKDDNSYIKRQRVAL